MNSKALEAAAKVYVGYTANGGLVAQSAAEDMVAAYLDEAGIPKKWCAAHETQSASGRVCIGTARSNRPCVIVDAVLVIGENE